MESGILSWYCYQYTSYVCTDSASALNTADPYEVLGVAVISLNEKPTKGSDFGKKVEFAMDLVSYEHAVVTPASY